MKSIRFTKHALSQCIERGTNELEVTEAILNGNQKPAKKGRLQYRYDFQFDREWQERFYAIKRVSPIVAAPRDRDCSNYCIYILFLRKVTL